VIPIPMDMQRNHLRAKISDALSPHHQTQQWFCKTKRPTQFLLLKMRQDQAVGHLVLRRAMGPIDAVSFSSTVRANISRTNKKQIRLC